MTKEHIKILSKTLLLHEKMFRIHLTVQFQPTHSRVIIVIPIPVNIPPLPKLRTTPHPIVLI
jgi:hypothetical protein